MCLRGVPYVSASNRHRAIASHVPCAYSVCHMSVLVLVLAIALLLLTMLLLQAVVFYKLRSIVVSYVSVSLT